MSGFSRRRFFHAAGSIAALAAARSFTGAGELRAGTSTPAAASASSTHAARAERVYQARLRAAERMRARASAELPVNGDEQRYPARWGNYSKGLPHDALGQVDAGSYRAYLDAIESADTEKFERIPLGGYVKLSNPQAAYAIDLIGPDSAQIAIATPPAFASAWQASELAEMYWHAALRDVSFARYDSDPLVARACADLTRMSDYRGPRENGRVTPATLFRGNSAAARRGPYISQFLLRDIPMSPMRVPQKIRTAVAGRDWMIAPEDWLLIQNGQLAPVPQFDTVPRYVRSGRDLSEYVHRDFTYQAALCACMMLFKMSAPLDGGIPYQYSITQGGFVTFGPSDVFHLVATVANLALKSAWYQKWIIHRRARPEELGGRVHFAKSRKHVTPLHRDILDAEVLDVIFAKNHSWLLPQAYPEGAPTHPSYPAGHAVIAGACATVLKACFAESWVLPGNVTAAADGLTLLPYKTMELTVGGELDKMAENIAFGRNFAGVHWRSDGVEGLTAGEAFAIGYLQEMKLTAPELFTGFGLTKFDGSRVTV